jgi:hypothetical protein
MQLLGSNSPSHANVAEQDVLSRSAGMILVTRRVQTTAVAPRLVECVAGSNNRGAVTVVSLGFSTRGLGRAPLARQAAERRQMASDEMRPLRPCLRGGNW